MSEPASEEPSGDSVSPPPPSAGPLPVDLPHGRGLSVAEASAITREAFSSVVLFAGTAKSGKTTLLATVYLLFQRAPFAGYLFAGSETLVGFEERTYLARVASRRGTPTTERTVRSELLHLRVRRDVPLGPVRDLLFCDFSGEDFREAKDSSEACASLPVMRRADYLVLLVDGEKLATADSRRRAKNDPVTLLRNCLDSGVLPPSRAVDVLVTKWDLIEAAADRDDIVRFVDHMEKEIERQFQARLATLRMARVAAHPTSGAGLGLGYGLEALFYAWAESGFPSGGHRTPPLPEPAGMPECDRYRQRRLGTFHAEPSQ